ncbi:MAG: CHAP domain-containing protein [Bacilli bacterium]
MKKQFIIVIILFLLIFIGCNNDTDERTLVCFQEEIFVYLDETAELPIEIAGYETEELEFVIENPEIIELDSLNIRPLAVGATDVIVRSREKPEKNVSIRVFVLRDWIAKPTISTSYPIMKVGQTAKLLFTNLVPVGAPYECFDWEVSDEEVAVIEDGLTVKALKPGATTITAALRVDPEITGSFDLIVVEDEFYRDDGKPAILLRTEGDAATLKAGEELQIRADFAGFDMDDYYWKVINKSVARIGENGNLMGCAPGIAKVYLYSKADRAVYGHLFVEVEGRPNVDYVARLIAAAEKELGYREASNGYTKYGFWYGTYQGHHYTNLHWCAMFVSWCINEAGISSTIVPLYANVESGKQNFSSKKIYYLREDYIPKAGDLIFFLRDGAGHTGIVTGCDGETVYTIEGNTSNMVARRSYPLDYHTIDGYASPEYPPYNPESE